MIGRASRENQPMKPRLVLAYLTTTAVVARAAPNSMRSSPQDPTT